MNPDCPATFIIPVFNVGQYLEELLESIRNQSLSNFQVIIGDDGSTDNTRSIAERALADSRFQYIRWEQNRGLGAVMRDLMGMVKTPFWCNPGGDDRLHRDFLEERLNAAADAPSCIMVHGSPRQIDSVGRQIHHYPVFELPREMDSSEFLELLLFHNVVCNPAVMVRTSVTRACLGHMRADLRYAPDWYWWILHASQPGSVIFDQEPRMDYRCHPQSLSGSSDKRWLRAEEIRRAPLLALHDASLYSLEAGRMLGRHGRRMRALWSARALRVLVGSRGRYGIPSVPWLSGNAAAKAVGLGLDLLCWPFFGIKERVARRGASFQPSGIMAANHKSFRVKEEDFSSR